MARIIFDLQLSSYDTEGNLLIYSDSNWQFTSLIAETLVDFGHECTILKPATPPFLSKKFKSSLFEYKSTEKDRYFLPDYLQQSIEWAKPDIIWTNDPCRVGNYRSFWDGPLIAYNHWVDVPSDPKMPPKKTYFFRQMEAAFKADYMLFNSQSGIKLFEDHITVPNTEWPRAKLRSVNPPLRTDLIKEVIDMDIRPSIPTLVFNHRLSSAPQYQTNVDNFFTIVDRLQGEFRVIFSNPSGKATDRWDRENFYNIHSQDYKTYLSRLAMGTCQLTLFEYPGQWSMAMAECLALGMMVIYPNKYGYKELAQAHPFGFMDVTSPAIDDLIMRNDAKYKSHQDFFLQHLSPEFIVETQVQPIIKDLT